MAKYKKLRHRMDVRLALLGSQATALVVNGKIMTTEAGAKEVRKIVEPLTALVVKEKDSPETASVTAKAPHKDANGKRVREKKDGRRAVIYNMVQKEVKKGRSPKIDVRRHMFAKLYVVGKPNSEHRKAGKKVDLVVKLFDEYGPRYKSRKGGYTRIIKIGLRKSDAAVGVLLELI